MKIIWGTLDRNTVAVSVHARQEQRDTEGADIIDEGCRLTILKRGEVCESSPNAALDGSSLGAFCRS